MNAATDVLVTTARRLVAALRFRDEEAYRVAVLKRVASELGDNAYPGFLRLLILVEESDDSKAKRLLAATLGSALQQMNLPVGKLTSWGATRLPESSEPTRAGQLSGFCAAGPERRLGPIEFLTVWSCQRTQRVSLSPAAYETSLTRLIALMNLSDVARTLYPQRLESLARNQIEGAFTQTATGKLMSIATAWRAAESPLRVARLAVGEADSANRTPPLDWLLRQV